MKLRAAMSLIFAVGLSVLSLQYMSATLNQLIVSLSSVIIFLGILFFDEKNQVLSSKRKTLLLALFLGILLLAINEKEKERFFLDLSGALLLISIFLERESAPWRGRIFLRTPLTGALIYFVLIIIQCIPTLSSETVLAIDLAAMLIVSTQGLYLIARVATVESIGSLTSCLYMILSGFAAYVYRQSFLPQISGQSEVFLIYGLILPAIAIILSVVSLFQENLEKKQIYFFTGWCLFLSWGALYQKNSGLWVVAGIVFASWILILNNNRGEHVFSRMFYFGMPGSLLFFLIIGILSPMGGGSNAVSGILWSLFFIVSWLGISKQNYDLSEYKELSWKQGLMVFFTAVIAAIMGTGMNIDFIKEKF